MTTETINESLDDAHNDDHHDHKMTGLKRWLYTTNHKDIGTLYLWFSFIMLLTGGALAMVIRAELFQPGLQIVEPDFFNQLTTVHGLIMVFGAIMPAFTGFANWMLPMMIGAPDMALPRMNNWSFWLQILVGHSTLRYQPPIQMVVRHFLYLLCILWVFLLSWGQLILLSLL